MSNTEIETRIDTVLRTEEVYLGGSCRPRQTRGWRVFVMDVGNDRVIETSPFFVQYGDPRAAAIEVAKRDAWIAERA